MVTVISQHVCHLGFLKTFILHKTAANFIGISRKLVFVSSNRNIINPRSLLERIFTRNLKGGG